MQEEKKARVILLVLTLVMLFEFIRAWLEVLYGRQRMKEAFKAFNSWAEAWKLLRP